MGERTWALSWEIIEEEERPWLTRFLHGRVPPGAVEDVLQDTWLSFWRLGEEYAQRGRRRPLLQRIAARRAADWHRVHPLEHLNEEQGTVDPEFTGDLLHSLGIKPGSLVWRRIVDDWSLAMLATHFDVPVGTIKSRLFFEKRDLACRLDDWRHSLSGVPITCTHARSDVLGVAPCPQCAAVRGVWKTLIARVGLYDGGFQTTYFSVESDLGLWFDAIFDMRHPVSPAECLWGNSLAVMGPVRRLRNAYGEDLTRRVHTEIVRGQDLLLFPIRYGDGQRFELTQHGTSSQAEAATLIRPSRKHVELHLDIGFGPDSNGATFLELPRTLAMMRADPAPTAITSLHDRVVLLWSQAAALRHYPLVLARYG